MKVISAVLIALYGPFFSFTSAELPKSTLCDPEGTLREFTTFEKVIHGAAYEKCVCHVGYSGRYCERIFRCRSGRPFAFNCTDPPKAFEASTRERCAIAIDREIDVCLCFMGYQGKRCEQTTNPLPMRIGTIRISSPTVGKETEESQEDNGGLAIVSPEFTQIDEDEQIITMERRFWYLAFCLALAGVLAVLLIGLYFLIMQAIYKAGLKHLTERELRRRVRARMAKQDQDTYSLPPSYEDVQQQQKFMNSGRIEAQPRPSLTSTIQTAVSIENMAATGSNNPQFRPLYVHV